MLSFTLKRPRLSEWRGWLPLALALGMFAALLALGGDRGYFYRDAGIHDRSSILYSAISGNLSAEHNFRLATRIRTDEDGGFRYSMYSRFPIGGPVLIKAVTAPFGDDVAAKLLAGRILALLMFCGAALCACLSIARATGSRAVAIAATLLGFSGLYTVYYADAVMPESVMDLFGVALAFHGMTVFVQEGRFRQLIVKTCAALLLGWHVYGLLLAFIALGLAGEAVALLRSDGRPGERGAFLARVRRLLALARSRYAALAAAAILFGSALLAVNLANEYAAYKGERTLPKESTINSVLWRLGLTGNGTVWDYFLEKQLYRVGVMFTPYSLARAVGYDFPIWETGGEVNEWHIEVWHAWGDEIPDEPLAPVVLGIAALCAGLAAIAFARRYRILVATAVLFGFCWSIPMRYHTRDTVHLYESLPYIGIGLTLFALALFGARRLFGARAVFGICAVGAAAAVFGASVFYAGRLDRNPREAERDYAEMADVKAMREIAGGGEIKIIRKTDAWSRREMRPWAWRFYLSGSYIHEKENDCLYARDADFTVAPWRHEGLGALTPDNRIWFLYGGADALELCRAERRRLESLEPAARGEFDVYLEDDTISYLKAPCAPEDYENPFYAYAHPVDLEDLPARHAKNGFHPTHFELRFMGTGLAFDDACMMTLQLPTYPIAAVETGQRIAYGETLWRVFAPAPLGEEALALYEDVYRETASSGDPVVRADFDLYMDGGALRYLKQPCSEEYARGRFFLSVHPVDIADLPAERREIGHESLNFTFAPPFGAFFNGKCMAVRQLPDYEIARIETGQWVPGGERLWDAAIVVGD